MTTPARAATGAHSPSSVNMTTRGRVDTAACSNSDGLVVSVKSETTSARPPVASGAASAAIIHNNSSSTAGGSSSATEAPDQDSKLNISVDIRHEDNGNSNDDNENDNIGSSNEQQQRQQRQQQQQQQQQHQQQQQQQQQQQTDEASGVESVAPVASGGQSQAVLQGVGAPVPIGAAVGRRSRRARRRELGDDCVAHRTRARAGRHLAHRTEGVRATRARVRAGEAYLVAGIR